MRSRSLARLNSKRGFNFNITRASMEKLCGDNGYAPKRIPLLSTAPSHKLQNRRNRLAFAPLFEIFSQTNDTPHRPRTTLCYPKHRARWSLSDGVGTFASSLAANSRACSLSFQTLAGQRVAAACRPRATCSRSFRPTSPRKLQNRISTNYY